MSTTAEVRQRHASALAWVESGRVDVASTELAGAMNLARGAGLTMLLPELALSAVWLDIERGELSAARTLLDRVRPELRGTDLARARCLYGLLHYATGEWALAVGELSTALRWLRRVGDRHWQANALVARGAAAAYLGGFTGADGDFRRAAAYFRELGEIDRAACCVHNRGFVALRRGDIPAALRFYDAADRGGLLLERHPELLVDRAETLLVAGLVRDARNALNRAIGLLDVAQRGTQIADLMLTTAECALRAGDVPGAREAATQAEELFTGQQRPARLPAARAVLLRADLAERPGTVAGGTVREVAADCERHGWQLLAAELLTAAAAAGVERTRMLETVARQRFARTGRLRVIGWLATARLAGTDADVLAAAQTGLRLANRHVASAGALEPRSAAAATAAELAGIGLAAAIRDGRPKAVLRWAERCNSADTPEPMAHPPALTAALATLRERETAALGSADPVAEHRLLAAERAVRRAAAESGAATEPERLRLGELTAALGDAALLSWSVHDGSLMAVSVVDGRVELHATGRRDEVAELADALRFAAMPRDGVLNDMAALAGHRRALRLDELLLAPLRHLIGDRPLVLVPADCLRALPWSALPSCRGRAVSVAPSARAWLHASRQRDRPAGGRVLAAGPRLEHAETEIRGLGIEGTLLRGEDCTARRLLSAMDGAELAHIAAHGDFRDEAPVFSGLRLADGLLYAHDLDRLRAPRLVVLSACELARPGERLSAALLRAGSAAVIASLLPVRDRLAGPLFTRVYQHLSRGQGPAQALAEAKAEHGDLGFVCIGAG